VFYKLVMSYVNQKNNIYVFAQESYLVSWHLEDDSAPFI